MKILSIDWDYFFPCADGYDWLCNEERGLFYEMIWFTRCDNFDIFTKKHILDHYKPSIPKDFWSIVANRPIIIVADSHARIYERLEKGCTVVSMDAHHDCGYIVENEFLTQRSGDTVDCANWREKGHDLIKEFHLYYPKWRKGHETEAQAIDPPTTISYGLPQPDAYDLIFVCRSSSWTPPWYDRAFQKFIKGSLMRYELRETLGWVPRKLNITKAKEAQKQFAGIRKQLTK